MAKARTKEAIDALSHGTDAVAGNGAPSMVSKTQRIAETHHETVPGLSQL